MPSKEIKELRQSGRLGEALKMAEEELALQPDNIWAKRNISWVYYEYIKLHVLNVNFDGFIENLLKLKELNLQEDDVMIFDNLTWQISSMVFKLQKTVPLEYSKINHVFDCIKAFHFTKPSEGYSLLYKCFHKGYKNWSRYLEFADWWDFNNLRPEDYLEEIYDSREIMALAEQAFIAYSKALLLGEPLDTFGVQRKLNVEKIENFLPKLNVVISNHKNYQYPIYFKVKLLLAIGDNQKVLSSFLPFAKQKKNDFWVWEVLAEIFEDTIENKMACLCKALSLKTKEDFLINTRKNMATLLIENKRYNEAKTEIVAIIKTRKKNKWRVPNNILEWTKQSWYLGAKEYRDNSKLYESHVADAEELLFHNVDETMVVVEFVNTDKKMLSFIHSKTLKGFFNYKFLKITPKIGDALNVRLEPIGSEGYHKVLTLKKTSVSSDFTSEVLKEVSGAIRIPEGKIFGFLEGMFVSPDVIKENSIFDGNEISGKAILTFNKKKDDWGWKVFRIDKK
jgi:tetratricopeptide (TPR) repeat protein